MSEPRLDVLGAAPVGMNGHTDETFGPIITAADIGIMPIDWPSFWAQEVPEEDYVISPIVPAGRQTGIYSVAKTGKSLLALDISAAGATGRSILGQPPSAPIDVVYLDLEMTEADLRERLPDLGYGPDDDLTRLHYFQLPALPPLDTDLGGETVLSICTERTASVLIVDTMARAVRGEENSADTYRNFYASTGRRLKAAGIALLRLDHQGKDPALGQRGSSAKVDDVDVVFKMTTVDRTRIQLTRTHSRVPWVPAEIAIDRLEEPTLRHVLAGDSWPAGTSDVALLLDELDVALDATVVAAASALRTAGTGKRKALVMAALKFRRTRP